MRVKLVFNKSEELIPIQNQDIVNSWIHKCLGENNKWHDATNDYSVSSLCGLKFENKEYLSIKNGAYIIVSSLNNEFIDDLLKNIDKYFLYKDIKISNIEILNEKIYDGYNIFYTLSPILIRNEKDRCITLNDNDFEKILQNKIRNKIKAINKNHKTKYDENLRLEIIKNGVNKVKLIYVHNNANKCNIFSFILHTNKQTSELLYNCGIGISTGSGFGTIYTKENKHLYKW